MVEHNKNIKAIELLLEVNEELLKTAKKEKNPEKIYNCQYMVDEYSVMLEEYKEFYKV
mgnify:FL=1|jgi:hypothetical protein|tara:strand:+ start:293 stop:466 length:174 start_codon:yes stop_codon:yes gene_type:complete